MTSGGALSFPLCYFQALSSPAMAAVWVFLEVVGLDVLACGVRAIRALQSLAPEKARVTTIRQTAIGLSQPAFPRLTSVLLFSWLSVHLANSADAPPAWRTATEVVKEGLRKTGRSRRKKFNQQRSAKGRRAEDTERPDHKPIQTSGLETYQAESSRKGHKHRCSTPPLTSW